MRSPGRDDVAAGQGQVFWNGRLGEVLPPFLAGQVAAGRPAGVLDGVLEAGVPVVDPVVVRRDHDSATVGPEVGRGEGRFGMTTEPNRAAVWPSNKLTVPSAPDDTRREPSAEFARLLTGSFCTFTGGRTAVPVTVSSTIASPW